MIDRSDLDYDEVSTLNNAIIKHEENVATIGQNLNNNTYSNGYQQANEDIFDSF